MKRTLAIGCSLAALLALGACGDRRQESTSAGADTGATQPATPEAAVRDQAQREATAEVARGRGT